MTEECGGDNGQPLLVTPEDHAQPGQVPLQEWLDSLEDERRVLIMRLRQIERNLMAHGRLRTPWATAVQETGTGR